jgi:hypothetical protein
MDETAAVVSQSGVTAPGLELPKTVTNLQARCGIAGVPPKSIGRWGSGKAGEIMNDGVKQVVRICGGVFLVFAFLPRLSAARLALDLKSSVRQIAAWKAVGSSSGTVPVTTRVDAPNATQLYGSYVGGPSDDLLSGIARDQDDNYYFGGWSGTETGDRLQMAGKRDSQYNPICFSRFPLVDPNDPSHVYDTASIRRVAVGRDGNFYVAGTAHNASSTPDDFDGFVELLSGTDCSVLATAIIGGPGNDSLNSVRFLEDADPSNDRVYLGGTVQTPDYGNNFAAISLPADLSLSGVDCSLSEGSHPYLCLWQFDGAVGVASFGVSPTASGDSWHGGYIDLSSARDDRKFLMVHVAPNGAIQAAQYLPSRYESFALDTKVAPDGDVLYAGVRAVYGPADSNALCFKTSNDFATVRWESSGLDTWDAGGIDSDEQSNAYCARKGAYGTGVLVKIAPDGTSPDAISFLGAFSVNGVAWGSFNSSATLVGRSWDGFSSTDGSTQNGPSDGYLYEAGNFQ